MVKFFVSMFLGATIYGTFYMFCVFKPTELKSEIKFNARIFFLLYNCGHFQIEQRNVTSIPHELSTKPRRTYWRIRKSPQYQFHLAREKDGYFLSLCGLLFPFTSTY